MTSSDWPITKIERAQEHLSEFNRACAEFIAEEPYREIEHDDQKRTFQLKTPPPYLGLVFGNFVHDLRSALDHVVFELVREGSKQLPRKDREAFARSASFPILTDLTMWKSDPECRQGGLDKLRGLVPSHIAHIKGLQPFNAGSQAEKHPLAVLAALDNRDKHRQLNVTVTSVIATNIEIKPGSYEITPVSPTSNEGTHKTVSVPDVYMNLKPVLDICLTEAGPAPGAVLWAGKESERRAQRLLRHLMFGPGILLPRWLVACVTGVVSELQPGN